MIPRSGNQTHLGCWRYAPWGTDCQVLIVGEDNPVSAAPEFALYPLPERCAGHRLAGIMGLSHGDYVALWRTNLCTGKWSAPLARERAFELVVTEGAPWTAMVLLGRKVADAFKAFTNKVPLEPFASCWHYEADRRVSPVALVSLPHSSGRNLLWNNPEMAFRARACLREWAPSVAWGSAL